MKAWKLGVIPALLDQGHDLKQAQQIAKDKGALVTKQEVDNLITSVGKQLLCNVIIDANTGLTYHAIGTDNTTPLAGDTTLTEEQSRVLFSSRSRAGNVTSLSAFYTAAESTYAILECGIFGGATASGTPDSGKLFSHYLQSYDNSGGTVDLTFDYELTLG
jgi:hypothetical protein